MLLAGCASTPPYQESQWPAVTRSVVGTPAVIDRRAEFREQFCALLHPAGVATVGREGCADYLWRLPDEKPINHSRAASYPTVVRATVLVVGGAFGDCFPPSTTPFVDGAARMRSADLQIDYIDVSGRSSSQINAKIIENRIALLESQEGRPLILLGYSKGVADILEALTRYPQIADKISAVVSVAGAVEGSPLAARYDGLYSTWLKNRRLGSCPPGDGGVLDSLTPAKRLNWLADHPLPTHIKYYSLGSFTTPPGLARSLRGSYRALSRIDARNDGQLLASDEIIPGSTLLGYAKADHWAVAINLEDRFPFLAHRSLGTHPFPQRVLFEAILRFVSGDLARSSGPVVDADSLRMRLVNREPRP